MNPLHSIMKRFFASIVLALAAAAAWALPSAEAVQAEVQHGNYAQAESMMSEVVAARPGSAKAHYVYAEILAHNRRFDQAAQELRQAKQIDPSIKFADGEKFQSFERLLEREQEHARAATRPVSPMPVAPLQQQQAPRSSGGFSLPGWGWILGIAFVAILLLRLLSASRVARRPYVMGSGAPGYGSAPPYGPMGAPSGSGGSMLGTGLAAAGGFAAGMLAEKMLDGRHEHAGDASTAGLQSGMFDGPARDEAADELEQRSIDFGSGGDWGGDGGGSSDDGGW